MIEAKQVLINNIHPCNLKYEGGFYIVTWNSCEYQVPRYFELLHQALRYISNPPLEEVFNTTPF